MQSLRELRLKTNCGACINKCCSQPYDWVYLTTREISRLEEKSGLAASEFLVRRQNTNTGYTFRVLNLPCRFLDTYTGQCKVYDSRPLVCRVFPFYPEPLTGHATLLPAQCGSNLYLLPSDSKEGWCLLDLEEEIRQWLSELWNEALHKE